MLTLLVLAAGVMLFAGGAGDWTKLSNINDPLPQAMKIVVGEGSGWLHMLVWIGLFGLIASFHGIIMGYSRQIYALARAGYLPRPLAAVNRRFRTPHWAILAGGVIGMAAIFSDEAVKYNDNSLTATIVTMSVFGAIVMYIVSMAALFKLRRADPLLERPYRVPFYPFFPAIALGLALLALAAMIYYNAVLFGVFVVIVGLGYVYFRLTKRAREAAPLDEMLQMTKG
jgi:ethanolamine permease